jgi:hypothetical protein
MCVFTDSLSPQRWGQRVRFKCQQRYPCSEVAGPKISFTTNKEPLWEPAFNNQTLYTKGVYKNMYRNVNLEAKKAVSDAITALIPADVDLLVQKPWALFPVYAN